MTKISKKLIKTPTKVYLKRHFKQLHAYTEKMNENTSWDNSIGLILHLNEFGKAIDKATKKIGHRTMDNKSSQMLDEIADTIVQHLPDLNQAIYDIALALPDDVTPEFITNTCCVRSGIQYLYDYLKDINTSSPPYNIPLDDITGYRTYTLRHHLLTGIDLRHVDHIDMKLKHYTRTTKTHTRHTPYHTPVGHWWWHQANDPKTSFLMMTNPYYNITTGTYHITSDEYVFNPMYNSDHNEYPFLPFQAFNKETSITYNHYTYSPPSFSDQYEKHC
jgi:hypothetical protein